MSLHARDVRHNDFHPRNIIVDDLDEPTRIVVVDFERATDHICERGCDLALYWYPPPEHEFNCEELYRIAVALEIWTPRTVIFLISRILALKSPGYCLGTLRFFGGFVSIYSLTKAEDLVKHGPLEGLYEPEVVLRIARSTWNNYFKKYWYRRDFILGKRYTALQPLV